MYAGAYLEDVWLDVKRLGPEWMQPGQRCGRLLQRRGRGQEHFNERLYRWDKTMMVQMIMLC